MNERLTPDTQRHMQVLQRYMLAMESGDIDSMAIVLREAEQDRALENMILEVNDFYQQEDHTIAEPADVTLVQQHLLNTIPAMREKEASVGTSAQSSNSKVNPVYAQTQVMTLKPYINSMTPYLKYTLKCEKCGNCSSKY